ncbi:MAG: hypothetical protein JJU29_20725 [Verrucomicrobia bacterium]|nr:hypothetical protein [Verrucomicrobiota bacterium]MCH8512345.1 hypothetical protein [Kiritimatiellia bacterium]
MKFQNCFYVLACGLFGLFSCAFGDVPAWVGVEVTWEASDGETRRLSGQLEFDRLPVTRLERGNFGITNLVPLENGEIQIRHTGETHEGAPVFVLQDYQGTHRFLWNVEALPVGARDTGMRGLEVGEGFDTPPPVLDLDLEEPEPVDEGATSEAPASFRLVPAADSPVNAIPVAALRYIHFQALADDGFRRQSYTGRYVQYSRAATGDQGRVQPVAATFLGGEGDEHFSHGGFFPDGRIYAAGMFHDLSFLANVSPRVIGRDTNASDYPPVHGTDRRGREQISYPASAPVIFVFSEDLSAVEEVIRLPWASGQLADVQVGNDGALYVALRERQAFESLAGHVGEVTVVENPGHVAQARQRAEARAEELRLAEDALLFRLSPNLRNVDWAVRFQHAGIGFTRLQSDRLVVQRGRDVYFVEGPTGDVRQGPNVEHGRSHSGMVVDPRDGSFYFGGEYHSGTGLEPWRCPFLRKFDPEGHPVWSAYDWTGPIVGVQFFRLVSDSAVNDVIADNSGRLLLRGWSDGGNSVFTRQPYDLRKPARVGGTASSIWGASVLSVSYLIQMDADSMEVSGVTRFLSYLPTSNTPNSISLRAYHQMENGQVAIFGHSAFGLIETQDSWFDPWYVQYRTNRHALARGGPFFALYAEGLQTLRISTILPGARAIDFAAKDDKLLLFGSAEPQNNSYGDETPAMTLNAVQSEFGGGRQDAYLLLVNTAGDPNPPQIPERSW